MQIVIVTDTRVNNEYMRAGSIVETSEAEGSRLVYLGWAKEVVADKPKKSRKATKK